MTDERKKQLLIGGSIVVAALILIFFFRGSRTVVSGDPIETAVVDGTLTPGLIATPGGGGVTTYNIPPYVPPNAPDINYNIGGNSIAPPVAQSACPCPKVCEGAPTYYASETSLLNTNPIGILNWYSNTVPPPPPEPEPVFIMGRNQLAASIESARATIQGLFGYGI